MFSMHQLILLIETSIEITKIMDAVQNRIIQFRTI